MPVILYKFIQEIKKGKDTMPLPPADFSTIFGRGQIIISSLCPKDIGKQVPYRHIIVCQPWRSRILSLRGAANCSLEDP